MTSELKGLQVVLGAGPVGRTLVHSLLDRDLRVRIVTRSGRAQLPEGAEHVSADIADAMEARRVCTGATAIYGCLGMGYGGWAEQWPPLMAGMLAGAESAGARFIFADNLYMYGPVDGQLHENLPLTGYGSKPAIRTQLTRMWQRAHRQGRVQAATLRASDFFGPAVTMAALGSMVFGPAIHGRTALLAGDVRMPHSFTYVPDLVRAMLSVAEADDDALGQAYHVPNAPALPIRDVVEMIFHTAGEQPRLNVMPNWMLGIAGLFNPELRELSEMMYQWTRPFVVDHSKFAARFWGNPTPLDDAIWSTVAWYKSQAAFLSAAPSR